MSCRQTHSIQDAYEDMVDDGIIEPLLTPFEEQFFDSIPETEMYTNDELVNIAKQDRTAQHREHSFPVWDPSMASGEGTLSNWPKGLYVELARLDINVRHLGILRKIDTLLIDATTGQRIEDWSDGVSWDPVFRYLLILRPLGVGNPFLKSSALYSTNSIERDQGRFSPNDSVPTTQIPGVPFHQLPVWEDQRYAWGNPGNKVFMPIQADYQLRLYVYTIEETELLHRVKGRLTATVQTEDSVSSAWAARRTADV